MTTNSDVAIRSNPEVASVLLKKAEQASEGYLVFEGAVVAVKQALKSKRMYEAGIAAIQASFARYRCLPSNTRKARNLLCDVEEIAGVAAVHFCLYLRDLSILDMPSQHPPLPEVVINNPVLKMRWDSEFAFMRAQLYSDGS